MDFLCFVMASRKADEMHKMAVLPGEKVGNGMDIGVDNERVSDCPPECPLFYEENGPFWAYDFL